MAWNYGKLTAEAVSKMSPENLEVLGMAFGKEPNVIMAEAQWEVRMPLLTAQLTIAASLSDQLQAVMPAEGVDWLEIGFQASFAVNEIGEIEVAHRVFLRKDEASKAPTPRGPRSGDPAVALSVARLTPTGPTVSEIVARGKAKGLDVGWTKSPRSNAGALLTLAGKSAPRGCGDEAMLARFDDEFPVVVTLPTQ